MVYKTYEHLMRAFASLAQGITEYMYRLGNKIVLGTCALSPLRLPQPLFYVQSSEREVPSKSEADQVLVNSNVHLVHQLVAFQIGVFFFNLCLCVVVHVKANSRAGGYIYGASAYSIV